MFRRGFGGEKVSRRHRWVSEWPGLGRGGERASGGGGEAPQGAVVRGLWGGAVCEGRA